ncbi:SDR family NAD(P)-dependent oxidoreductase [Streptomyces sp. NPDC053780]|uniref:SDR family NAD(P)-dependent oxidoreductase n=1 Tax=unclassified Streptomyces TaxID=2593676 RepID=UPI00343804F7
MPATTTPATWFVTGASRGLGLELVRQLLAQGDNVAATTRSAERLTAALGSAADTGRLLALTVDLADEAQVENAVEQATERFGRLDVVVNNAGYGFLAAVEETSAKDVRDMLDATAASAAATDFPDA